MTKPIKIKKHLTWVPTNALIDKTYTGVGGTTAEMVAERNSIILMPSLNAIKDKVSKSSSLYDNSTLLGIYGGHNDPSLILEHLNKPVPYKKILMTMSRQSICKLLEAAQADNSLYDFNLLCDEIDSCVDESSYREDLSLVMDLVKLWKSMAYHRSKAVKELKSVRLPPDKAKVLMDKHQFKSGLLPNVFGKVSYISATGVGFLRRFDAFSDLACYKVVPDGRLTYPVEVLNAARGEVETSLMAAISQSSTPKTFIFYNNVDGCSRLIEQLGASDCRIYCGEGSKSKAGESYSNDTDTFAKYNFCTKAYMRAIDFNAEGSVIIASDAYSLYATLTVEDIVQAAGRIRKTLSKLTIVMNTKEQVKWAGADISDALKYYTALANQELGTIKTLEMMGDLTQSKIDATPSVRKDIHGQWAINELYIMSKVKEKLQDNPNHASVSEMIRALEGYDIKAKHGVNSVANVTATLQMTWEEKVNTAINALSMDNALIYKMVLRNGTPEQILISQGLELFSPSEVANTKSKKELSDKINEYRTREAKSSIGIALSKKGLANSWISSESAKEMLKSLFQLYGYEATAKGSSIGEFFNSTVSKSVSKGGKAVKGYSLGSAKYSITES